MRVIDGKAILEKGDIDLGRPFKAKRKIWAKLLKGVDTSQRGGYAFIGEWLRTTGDPRWIDAEVPIPSLIVATRAIGSTNHPRTGIAVFKVTEDGVEVVYENYFDHQSESKIAVQEIAEVFEEEKANLPSEVKELTEEEENEVIRAKLNELIDEFGAGTVVQILEELLQQG